ncbi:hypothetical protein O164_28280 [Pseudomonas taiwanensis SJ9]|uniref:Uncharacterized protein n=1 Tax=Pseudomonas taiwanensis SJ9 TaxID=1388762 RepID=V7D337_9PSED|nr:hypothetical protein O164_28280 [Pseudomonas taiwanensis SJ9]
MKSDQISTSEAIFLLAPYELRAHLSHFFLEQKASMPLESFSGEESEAVVVKQVVIRPRRPGDITGVQMFSF